MPRRQHHAVAGFLTLVGRLERSRCARRAAGAIVTCIYGESSARARLGHSNAITPKRWGGRHDRHASFAAKSTRQRARVGIHLDATPVSSNTSGKEL